MPTAKEIDGAITKHMSSLKKPGVLFVRPGFEIANHRLTGSSAVVATVHAKKKQLPQGDALPTHIAGIPVDVREATPQQRLRAKDPVAAAVTDAFGRPENRDPVWPLEREMPSGTPTSSPKSSEQKTLKAAATKSTAAHRALSANAKKKNIPYVPASVPLRPVTGTMTITAHVSPDAGLVTLEDFLGGTQKSLVVGMYDFTSGTILQHFESALTGKRTLQMVLDNPAPNPTRDQLDSQTVDSLNQQLGARAQIVRAAVRSDSAVTEWIFPYAYHIKVIVRDGSTFWLSSGNLNNSNQPVLASPPHTEDRDWHVIVDNAELAGVFSAYINQDFISAKPGQIPVAPDESAAIRDANLKLVAETDPSPAPAPPQALSSKGLPKNGVAAKVFKDVHVTVTPLLTPDTIPGRPSAGQYQTQMLALIKSATKTLYIQLQYIESSGGHTDQSSTDYAELLTAVADRVKNGVDVKMIQSAQYGEKWAEKMKSSGVDLTSVIWLQQDVHNKGYVIDSKIVVVSSQNWSPAGIRDNRDAGVIIENPDIAQYFEQVFLSDLKNKAKPFGAATTRTTSTKKTKSAAPPRKKKKTAAAGTKKKAPAKVAKKAGKTRAPKTKATAKKRARK